MEKAVTSRARRWPWALLLLWAVLVGFFVRFDSLFHWLDVPDRYFFGEPLRPLTLTVDAYYYLDIAEQLTSGGYEPFDPRRQVPNGLLRSPTPPLLSVMLATLSKLSSASLEWVAILLPPFLSVFLAVPAFFLGRALGLEIHAPFAKCGRREAASNVMGLVAALFTLLSPHLVSRGIIGWCDTDTLNVAFSVVAALLALRYADEEDPRRRRYWFVAWAVTFLLFLWWWDQAYVSVFALAGLPMSWAVLTVGWRRPRALIEPLAGLALLTLIIGLWKGFSVVNPAVYLDRVSGLFAYLSEDAASSPFPAAASQVAEQRALALSQIVRETAGGWVPFALAVVGLSGLLITARRHALFLVPVLIVAALSLQARRFEIFVAPLFGLGMGFLALLIWGRRQAEHWRIGLMTILLLVGSWGALAKAREYDSLTPLRSPVLFEAMVELREQTPEGAVIWSTWGNGHPLVFYAKRGTVGDGIFHPASLQYALAFPLATDSLRLAANWITFNVAHGQDGLERVNRIFGDDETDWASGIPRLQKLLAVGVEESREILEEAYGFTPEETEEHLAFLFPGDTRPTYLFLDYLLLRGNWYSLGTWDFESKTTRGGKPFALMEGVSRMNQTMLRGQRGSENFLIDLERGLLRIGEQSQQLKEISIHDGQRLERAEFPGESTLAVRIFGPARLGVFTDLEMADTALIRLYFELQFDERYFRPVHIGLPVCSIWRVQGDKYASRAAPDQPKFPGVGE